MVSAYLNVAMDQTIPGLLPEVTPRFNRFSTNQHNLLLRASAFRQPEQRNRNTGKQEHWKTGTSENRNIWKQEQWKTGTSEKRNNGKQKHLKTGTLENRNIWKQEQRNRIIWKQEQWKTRSSETRTSEYRNTAKEHLERINILIKYKLKLLEQSKKKIAN